MSHRGLAVLTVAALAMAAALLVPADARADRHGIECFGGYSFASSNLKGPSISCGVYVDFFVPTIGTQGQEPLPSPTPSPAATPPPTGPAPGPSPSQTSVPARPARRWFAVGDVSRLKGDDDAGTELTRHLITIGLQRYLLVRAPGDERPKRFHPFLRAMGGLTVDGGRGPARYGPALAAGAGMDVRVWESRTGHGWGNLFLRGQCDAAYLFEPGETTWRCAVGPSLRRED